MRGPRRTPGSYLRDRYGVRKCCTRYNVGVRRSEFRRWGTRRRCAGGAAAVASIRHEAASGPGAMADDGVDRLVVGKLACNSVAAMRSERLHTPGRPTTKSTSVTVRVMAHSSCMVTSSNGPPL